MLLHGNFIIKYRFYWSLHWMNRSEYKRFFWVKFWVWCVKTMTVKCSSGGCQITENKIESHQGEHTIYLSHSKRGILFLPTKEARHSWRLLVHKHAIRGNQPPRCEANYSECWYSFLLKNLFQVWNIHILLATNF